MRERVRKIKVCSVAYYAGSVFGRGCMRCAGGGAERVLGMGMDRHRGMWAKRRVIGGAAVCMGVHSASAEILR